MLNGFIVLKPDSEVAKQLELLTNIHDPDHVLRHRAFEDWFKHTQDIPGAFYLWIVEHLFRDNALIRGKLTVGGERVDLRRIRCPVNLLAGATDHITPAPQVFALAGAVSTPRKDVTRRSPVAGTSGSSWAARRCATTGRRSSATSSPARSPPSAAAPRAAAPRPRRRSTGTRLPRRDPASPVGAAPGQPAPRRPA